jgi:hypothetical protein
VSPATRMRAGAPTGPGTGVPGDLVLCIVVLVRWGWARAGPLAPPHRAMSTSKLLSIEEAAEHLGVPMAVLRGLRERRLVPVAQLSKRIWFRPEDLDRLVEARLEPAIRGTLAPRDVLSSRRVRW